MKKEIENTDYRHNHTSDPSGEYDEMVPFFSIRVWTKALKFLIPLIIVAVVVVLFIGYELKMNTLADFQKEQEIFINAEAELLDDDMGIVFAELQYLAALAENNGLFERYDGISSEVLQTIEESILVKVDLSRNYPKVAILDIEGNEILRINKQAKGVAVVSDSELQNKADRYYFIKSLTLDPGQIYVTGMDLQVEHGDVVQTEKPVIRFIKALRDSRGETKGVLVLYYDADNILERIRITGHIEQNLMLLNPDGYWLYGTESDKKWGFAYPDREMETFEKYHPEVWREIQSMNNGRLVTSKGSFVFTKVDPFEKLGIDLVTDDDSYPLILVSLVPDDLLAAANRNSVTWLTFSVTSFTILLVIIIVLVLRSREDLAGERNKIKGLYYSVIKTQQEMIARYLPDTTLIFVNDAYCRAFGKSFEELVGQKYLQFIPSEMHEKELASIKSLRSAHPFDTREFEVKSPDGSTRWQEWTDIAVFNESGEVLEIQGVGHDITERKQLEDDLREREHRLHQAQRLAHIGSWEWNLQTGETHWSPENYAIHGYDQDSPTLTPDMLIKAVYPDDQEMVSTAISRVVSEGKPANLEYRVFRPDGSIRVIHAISDNVEFDAEGKPSMMYGTNQDITERKKAEEQMQSQMEQLTALHAIDTAISGSTDLKLILNVVLEQVTNSLGMDAASLLLLNPHTNILTYAAGSGFRTNSIEESQIRIGEGTVGKALFEQQLVHIPEPSLSLDFSLTARLKNESFADYYVVPLTANGHTIGVLEIFHRTSHEANEGWLTFLGTLAGQVAIAVEKTRLFDDLRRTNINLINAYDATIEGWSYALDLRDEETEGHTQRVTEMTLELSRAAGLTEEELVHVRRGSLLHDIGKMGVPDCILLKPDKLTDEEWIVMRKHPALAYEMLSRIEYLIPALDIPYCHHEKWDGSGYPRGLKGEEIPFAARIFAVVDVWDALTSDRPYRPAWSKEKAFKYILENSGTHFDPKIVEIFPQFINGHDQVDHRIKNSV